MDTNQSVVYMKYLLKNDHLATFNIYFNIEYNIKINIKTTLHHMAEIQIS